MKWLENEKEGEDSVQPWFISSFSEQQSDEVGEGKDRNNGLVKQRTGRFQVRDC